MTKEQLIQIAKVGFPERVKQFIDFEKVAFIDFCNVYRLYEENTQIEGVGIFSKQCYISIHIGEDDFIQIQVQHKAFNHYAAIKEMEKLGLIGVK